MKEQNLRKGETELYLISETQLNILSSNYAITMPSNNKRLSLRRETKSFVRNRKWRTVRTNTIKDLDVDWKEIEVKTYPTLLPQRDPPNQVPLKRNMIDSTRTWNGRELWSGRSPFRPTKTEIKNKIKIKHKLKNKALEWDAKDEETNGAPPFKEPTATKKIRQ